MKLKFQDWYGSKHFSDNVTYLFNSAVTCYKAEVYTASLLMSYLAFLTELKERLMKATKPDLLPEQNWRDTIKGLKDENNWETSIYKAVMKKEQIQNGNKTEASYFIINENIRTQISYWRDRRNDCAHSKDNAISDAHVEAFWSFLESNLQKITVEGGMANLLQKFSKHFDPAYTSADEDIFPLIKEIKGAVEKRELNEFWDAMFTRIVYSDFEDHSFRVIKGVLSLADDHLSSSMIFYLKEKEELLLRYLSEDTSILIRLGYNPQEISNFWHNKIARAPKTMKIYAALLRNNMIPINEIQEANEKLSVLYKYTDDPTDHAILKDAGFGLALERKMFDPGEATDPFNYWKKMNRHAITYRQYLEHYPFNEVTADIICTQYNMEFHSFDVQRALKSLFSRKPEKKAEFEAMLRVLDREYPIHLIENEDTAV